MLFALWLVNKIPVDFCIMLNGTQIVFHNQKTTQWVTMWHYTILNVKKTTESLDLWLLNRLPFTELPELHCFKSNAGHINPLIFSYKQLPALW